MKVNSAIILAGGFGTRLQSVVQDIPKPMAPIKGKPFLEYLLIYLLKNKITEVVLSVGYLNESIISYFGNKFGKHIEVDNRIEYRELNISYAVENKPLGTGGGIKLALSKLKSENTFVLNGDSFFDIDLKKLSDFYFEKDCKTAIALRKIYNAGRYGTVVIDGDNRIVDFCEKHCNHVETCCDHVETRNDHVETHGRASLQEFNNVLINAGIYIMNKNLLDDMPEKFSFEKDFLEKKENDIYGLSFDDDFIDIGIPEDYLRAEEILLPYSSALFLDRDGVINKRIIDGYVTKPEEFIFLDGAIEAIKTFSEKFERIFIVSNQQGVSKGIMTCENVEKVHDYMLDKIIKGGGRIDKIYFCPHHNSENHPWRKPNTGMALQAKIDFPEIDFDRSIMIGDSNSDMIFGKSLNMKTVFIGKENAAADICCDNLADFSLTL